LVENFFIGNVGQNGGIGIIRLLVGFVFDPIGSGDSCNGTALEEWRLSNIGSPDITEVIIHEIVDAKVDGHQEAFSGRCTMSNDHGFVAGRFGEVAGNIPGRQGENQGLSICRHREDRSVLALLMQSASSFSSGLMLAEMSCLRVLGLNMVKVEDAKSCRINLILMDIGGECDHSVTHNAYRVEAKLSCERKK